MRIRVRRQDAPDAPSRIDAFDVAIPAGSSIHAALVAIRDRPVTVDGRRVDPPAWDAACLEGSCGGCTVRLGGRAVLACATAVDAIPPGRHGAMLEPMGRFPVLRDLVVDRDREAAANARLDAGALPAAASSSEGPLPAETPAERALRGDLAACIGCGACIDACPETGGGSPFVGAEAIAMSHLARLHPARDAAHEDHLAARLSVRGGVADCGHAQACVEACPVEVPLAGAIADGSRVTSRRWLTGWMRR